MSIGQLVKYVDYEAGAGFAPCPTEIGIIVGRESQETIPTHWIILTSSGDLCCLWGDELEVISG